MKYFVYPFWKNQIFFDRGSLRRPELKLLFKPYSLVSYVSWNVWTRFPALRLVNTCRTNNLPIPMDFFEAVIGNCADLNIVINTGTSGVQEKFTVYLFKGSSDVLFLKYARSIEAKQYLQTEINALSALKNTGLAPVLRKSGKYNGAEYFITDFITSINSKNAGLTTDLLHFLIELGTISQGNCTTKMLRKSMSHGDFCPWNLLLNDDKLMASDWEMADQRFLGYDLFTFIFQTQYLLHPKKTSKEILDANLYWIDQFFCSFSISNWKPYLHEYALDKLTSPHISKRIQDRHSEILDILKYESLPI